MLRNCGRTSGRSERHDRAPRRFDWRAP